LICAFLTEAPDVFEDKGRKISEPIDTSMVAKARGLHSFVQSGEAVDAFMVQDWGTRDRTGAYRFCRNRIAIYKEPHFVEFVDSLPRNPAGKILKRELRARAQKTTEPSGYGVRL